MDRSRGGHKSLRALLKGEACGKNEQVKKVFWTLFISMEVLVKAQVLDPVTAQQIVKLITGMGI
ncbi:MAG: hypothetical protein Q8S57_02905 [Methanoregula sp.]|nr:hypothetical protein [Methanoregula sp.]